MSNWTDQQTVAIARRVVVDQTAGQDRRLWAASTLAAAEHMGAELSQVERDAWREVMQTDEPTRARICDGARITIYEEPTA